MYNNYNPYYYSYMQPQQMQMQNQQPVYKNTGLQGKSVDSLDVVKAMDIPLDGSVSYFPLVDGTAIVTKQLQQDGTSKTIVYKPIENETVSVSSEYITKDDLDKAIKKINVPDTKEIKDIKDELKAIKRQVRDIVDDIKDKKED